MCEKETFNKHATLCFERKELLDDIKGYAYVEGDMMKRDDVHDRHQVFDVCEPGNIELVTRILNTTFNKCVELCYPYAKKVVRECTGRDNELETEDEYVMRLHLPDTFSETTVTLLESLIHDLLVIRVMEKWMGLTKPERVDFWKKQGEDTEAEIVSALSRRFTGIRRRLSPF